MSMPFVCVASNAVSARLKLGSSGKSWCDVDLLVPSSFSGVLLPSGVGSAGFFVRLFAGESPSLSSLEEEEDEDSSSDCDCRLSAFLPSLGSGCGLTVASRSSVRAGGWLWNLSNSRWASTSASPMESMCRNKHLSSSASFPNAIHSSTVMAASALSDGG